MKMTIPPFNERNPILLREARLLLERDRKFIGASSSGTSFYSLGSFHSNFLEKKFMVE